MAIKLVKEVEVSTVGELRAALAGYPDEMPLSDWSGELLTMHEYEDSETGDRSIEVV